MNLEDLQKICDAATPDAACIDTRVPLEIKHLPTIKFLVTARTEMPKLIAAVKTAKQKLQLITKCSGREAWEFAEYAIKEVDEILEGS